MVPASDGLETVSSASGILGNVSGIYVPGNNNEIGSAEPAARNVISGNNGSAISVNNGEGNIILGNYIGVARDGNTPLPNNYGIQLNGAAIANVVGGIADGEPNLIAYNSVNGLQIGTNVGGEPVKNEVRGNSIFENRAAWGLTLAMMGLTPMIPVTAIAGKMSAKITR